MYYTIIITNKLGRCINGNKNRMQACKQALVALLPICWKGVTGIKFRISQYLQTPMKLTVRRHIGLFQLSVCQKRFANYHILYDLCFTVPTLIYKTIYVQK